MAPAFRQRVIGLLGGMSRESTAQYYRLADEAVPDLPGSLHSARIVLASVDSASGRSAVEVVERRVETPVPMPPTRRDWPRLLSQLVQQLDGGRVYDRDLDELSVALAGVLDAVNRRVYIHSRTTRRPR
jgi:hypothetical protein